MMRIWKMALPEWRFMLLASLWAFLTTGSSIGLMMCSGWILTLAALHPSIAAIAVPIVGVRFFGIARGAFRWLDRVVAHETALRLLERFRIWFYQKLEPLVPIGVHDLKHGDLMQAIARDVDSLEFLYARVVSPPLVALWTACLMFVLLGVHGLHFALVFLAFQALSIAVSLLTTKLLNRWASKARQVSAELQEIILEMQAHVEELQIAGTWNAWKTEALRCEAIHNDAARRTNFVVGFAEAFVPLCSMLGVVGVTLLGGQEVIAHQLDPVLWVSLVLGTWAAYESVQGFPAMAQALQSSRVAGLRLLSIADRKPFVVQKQTMSSPTLPAAPLLSIQNITYSWTKGSPVFSNFSLTLQAGKSLVLLGDSGVGKTTLVNILSRYLDAESGSIYLAGILLASIPGDEARARIAVLDQHPHIFTGTLADNLRIADPKASESSMQLALVRVGLWDWAQECNTASPTETWVGEQGKEMSGGQRQRLACARILLRPASIVILDEPAAHLDPDSESKLLELFITLAQEQQWGLLVITHRMQFVHRFDQVIRLLG